MGADWRRLGNRSDLAIRVAASELLTTALDPHLDRGEREAEGVGDFLVGEPVEIPE